MDELKKDMDALNMGMKTDVEILRELVNLYKNKTISEEQRLNILTDLEYYVHQVGLNLLPQRCHIFFHEALKGQMFTLRINESKKIMSKFTLNVEFNYFLSKS